MATREYCSFPCEQPVRYLVTNRLCVHAEAGLMPDSGWVIYSVVNGRLIGTIFLLGV